MSLGKVSGQGRHVGKIPETINLLGSCSKDIFSGSSLLGATRGCLTSVQIVQSG